jgi:hypothetical protein
LAGGSRTPVPVNPALRGFFEVSFIVRATHNLAGRVAESHGVFRASRFAHRSSLGIVREHFTPVGAKCSPGRAEFVRANRDKVAFPMRHGQPENSRMGFGSGCEASG